MIFIDGHNLIPKIKGLTLSMLDDEMELIQILSEYARLSRKKLEVYFDNAPFDKAGTRKFGRVTAHFIRQGSSADDAIMQRVSKMGGKARNVKIITSDQRIQRQVQSHHAQTMTSEVFVKEIEKTFATSPGGGKPDPERMSEGEIEQWMNIFGKNSKKELKD
jgi:hypothetical protein